MKILALLLVIFFSSSVFADFKVEEIGGFFEGDLRGIRIERVGAVLYSQFCSPNDGSCSGRTRNLQNLEINSYAAQDDGISVSMQGGRVSTFKWFHFFYSCNLELHVVGSYADGRSYFGKLSILEEKNKKVCQSADDVDRMLGEIFAEGSVGTLQSY